MSTAMTPRVDRPTGVQDSAGRPTWGSDVVLDVLRQLDIEYAAIVPGSTFRGIHDSAVNYTANDRPELILCNHEMITVAMATGYARATGRAMAAIVHNVVGLLNTAMTIYDAWVDRVPVLVLGGAGPLDARHRRPWIDWIHTAMVQGALVRDFTKWDDQPASVGAIPESLLRAHRLAMTEPQGPVYVGLDVDLQEANLPQPFELPAVARYGPPRGIAPDPGAVAEAADRIVGAELPLAFADRVGRSADAVRSLVELAELLAMPVVNLGGRHSFPTPHPLDFAGFGRALLPDADVVVALEVEDLDGAMRQPVDHVTREAQSLGRVGQYVISIAVDELIHRAATTEYQALPAVDLPMLGSTRLAIPLLLEECRRRLDASARRRIDDRRTWLQAQHDRLWERQRLELHAEIERPGITEPRLLRDVWQAVKAEDYVFTYARIRRMGLGICEIPGPERYLSGHGGGAVGAAPGIALGSALALRAPGRVPVAIVGDGELLASIQAFWTAAHYGIPTLWVIDNNRSYFNDEAHQARIARVRGRPPENSRIGQRLENPEVDFAAIARTFDFHAEGPITDPGELPEALSRAVSVVREGGSSLVDVWTEGRPE